MKLAIANKQYNFQTCSGNHDLVMADTNVNKTVKWKYVIY